MKKQINIKGMSCSHCVNHVNNALNEIEGVKNISVDLEGKKAVIECDKQIEDKTIKDAIEDAGYDVVSITEI